MLDYFNGQKTLVTVEGKQSESIMLTRGGRANTRFAMNNLYKGLIENDSLIEDGDIINDGIDTYFVIASRKAYRSNQVQLYKTNCMVNVTRLVENFVNGTQVGVTNSTVASNLPSLQETVTASMKVYDVGLLPSTIKKFIVPKCNVQLQDIIQLGSDSFQVDAINDTDFPGLLYLQCSIAKRMAK